MFWCKFGGVPGGGGVSMEDSDGVEVLDVGVDGSDIVLRVEDDIRGRCGTFKSVAKVVFYGEGACGVDDGKMTRISSALPGDAP